ncbi:DUF4935 domain-containing protein [Nostoc sp. UCD121]|uniref:PIN domain-containing protein n=1 Tax=Nostoc sp. UCD121 TaxID=2681305 RepID=UPI0016278E4C|nr:PIN domain-containing protein [Nostoc sp. UCD121]MBC1280268.1 DUF4935 domain-containing protein [Nostoc sp. UCD121]
MDKRLQTSQVFIDTEVFINANFQFSSGRLSRLYTFNVNGKITLHLTDITIREIKANLKKQIEEVTESVNKFQTKAKLLRGVPSFEAIFNYDRDLVLEHYEAQLRDFTESRQLFLFPENHYIVNIISTKNVAVEIIFDKYFNQQPPFGEAKKKSEFPDAFTISALEKWCCENHKTMYVISNDSDMKAACNASNYLISIANVDELFDLITAEDKYISSIAHQWFTESREEIKNEITDKFEELELFDLVDVDKDGEIEKITVNNINLLQENLVEIQDEILYFTVIAEISFSVDVS